MPNRLPAHVVAALSCSLLAGGAWASAVDNINSASSAHVRHHARNAVGTSADAVFFHPAGTVWMAEGLHVSLSNQTFALDYRHEYEEREYRSSNWIPLFPHLYALYRRGQWAAFGSFTIPGGAGGVHFDEGTASTAILAADSPVPLDVAMDAAAGVFGATVGGAYAVDDRIAISAAVRVVRGARWVTMRLIDPSYVALLGGETLVDYEASAWGVGGILALSYRPTPQMTLSARYATITRLTWETTRRDLPEAASMAFSADQQAVLDGMLPPEGQSFERDLPADLGMGAAYRLDADLEVAIQWNYFFQRSADWGGEQRRHRNGWEVATGAELTVIPDLLVLSAGASYGRPGPRKRAYVVESPGLPWWSAGGGALIRLTPAVALDLGFAVSGSFADVKKVDGAADVELTRRSVTAVGLGVELYFGPEGPEGPDGPEAAPSGGSEGWR